MRARVVIPVLVMGLLLAGAVWWLRPRHRNIPFHPSPAVSASAPSVAANPGPALAPPKAAPAQVAHRGTDANVPGMESPQAREQDYVQQRVAQLMDLGMDDQPSSLQTILGELNNREPEIRQAALQAAMQFGSRDAIPRLREAVDQTDDVREKAAIQDAIEFLQATPMTELVAARAAAAGAPATARPVPARKP